MTVGLLEQEKSYRRGVVLGLTMAEVVVLVLFALLLALALRMESQDRQMMALEDRIAEMEKAVADKEQAFAVVERRTAQAEEEKAKALAELHEIRKFMPLGNDFDDVFKKLVLAEKENAQLRDEMAALKEQSQRAQMVVDRAKKLPVDGSDPVARMDEAAERLGVLERIIRAVEKGGALPSDVERRLVALAERAAKVEQMERHVRELEADADFARRIREVVGEKKLDTADAAQRLADLASLGVAAERAAGNGKDAREFIQNAASIVKEERSRADNLQGQLAQLKRKSEEAGRGTEKPACWATKEGKIEYIFDVALRPTGVVVRDNALLHRAEDQAQLPLSGFRFMSEVNASELRAAAQPLHRWSEGRDCRFFVRVYDETGASEKGAYKRMLRTVGEFFYYYEPTSGSF